MVLPIVPSSTSSSGSNCVRYLSFTFTSTSPGDSAVNAAEPGCTSRTTSMPVPLGNALRTAVSVSLERPNRRSSSNGV